MSNSLHVQWTITPEIAPRPWLNCNRCGDTRPFASSDKVRVNANGKCIDAWLIYKCLACENSWNRPLLERRNVGEIDPSTLHALQTNSPDLVRRAAFDVDDLKRKARRVEESAAATIRKEILSGGETLFTRLEISLIVREPTSLRADRLLASEFDVPRARVQELLAKGRLALFPHGARMLRRPVRDGMRISIDVSAEDDIDVGRITNGLDAGSRR